MCVRDFQNKNEMFSISFDVHFKLEHGSRARFMHHRHVVISRANTHATV